jgi:hypothetical protein
VHARWSSRRWSPNFALAASRRCLASAMPSIRWGTGELHVSLPTSTLVSSSTTISLHLSKPRGDIVPKAHVASVCFKCFRLFSRCVASVSHRCYKSRLGCCICCNGYTRMFQGCFLIIHLFFLKHVASVFILDIAYVLRTCCKCFILMLHMLVLAFQVFSDVLQVFRVYVASISAVSDICCKYFIWMLQK